MKRNRQWKIPQTVLASVYLNLLCIEYRIQNIHTFAYQKTLFHALFCLFLNLPKAFSVPLK